MHQGRPYGLHVIGGKLTDRDEAFVSVTAKRFSNLKDASSLDSLRLVYDLPDGGSFVIQDMGGTFRVIAYKPVLKEPDNLTDGLAKPYIPMLFSGALAGAAVLRDGQKLPLNLSRDTQRRIYNYIDNKKAPRYVELQRFVCEYGYRFQEFMPEHPVNGITYTQYVQQRPTWYSGAMAEVMQIIGGYGRQDLENLPNDSIERATVELPSRYQEAVLRKIGSIRLPAYTGIPNRDGQFQYDYKFEHTDIVAFDSDNKPWLVKVDRSGVWAMPLPIVPATATSDFRDYMIEVGDNEIIAILDRFGAMPSGESFPVSGFEDWRRAGVIIKVCDVGDFYSHSAYSTAMGWSCNSSGTEAVNTCYDANLTPVLITSYAYKLRLRLGAAKNGGWIVARKASSVEGFNGINAYLDFIYRSISTNSSANSAIKYKLNSVSLDFINERVKIARKLDATEIDYWRNLTLDPIASHEGTVIKIDEGAYFGGSEVKVPEPLLDSCISIPITRAARHTYKGKNESILLAYYIGDSLKTVKSSSDDKAYDYTEESNFERIMYVGKWQKREMLGGNFVSGSLYLSDADDRIVTAPIEIDTDIVGKDLGFSPMHMAFRFYFWKIGIVWRYRYYTRHFTRKVTYDRRMVTAVTIPYFCRNIIIYAKEESTEGFDLEESFSLGTVKDPYEYDMWTDAQSIFLFGSLPVMNGKPYPTEGRPVYAEISRYNPTEENSWADNGPWIPHLPTDITDLIYNYQNIIWAKDALPPPPNINEYNRVNEFKGTSKGALLCQVFDRLEQLRDGKHDSFYYSWSPDIFGNLFYVDACKVVFGTIKYANLSEVTESGNRKQWGESSLVNNSEAHHFIGVINE